MINKLNYSPVWLFLTIWVLLPGIVKSQQLVTWTNLVNTTVSNNVLTKSAGTNGWNAGAESQNMLAFGQDGWVEFTLQEVTCTKAIGISYEPSTTVLKDSIKYGFIFTFSGSSRVLKTKKLNDTSYTNSYNLNDVFRIEKAGTKILFLKNGVKLDSATMLSNDKSFFIDASISTLGGQFHSVRTSFPFTSNTTINPDKDAMVSSLNPTTNYCNYIVLIATQQTNGGIPNTLRGLIEFDLSSIPRNAKIVTSKLYLYSRDPASYAGHRCDGYCTGNAASFLANDSVWSESTVTWNTKPRYDDNTYFSIPSLGFGYCYYIDVIVESRNVVQKWVDGTKVNYGATFKVNNEVRYTWQQYKSSDDANTSERPRLEVKYYVGTKYYVNDNSTSGDVFCKAAGSSANTGLSPYSPLNRIDSVLKKYVLGALDTIFVDAGNYTEAITFNNSDYGSSTGKLVLCGAGKSKTIFTAPASTYNMTFDGASYVSVENLTLKTSQTNCYNISMNGASSNISMLNDSVSSTTHYNFYIDGASNIILSDNKVINSKLDTKQFYITSGCNNISIIDNSILNNSGKSIGVYLTANSKTNTAPSNIYISNNQISVDSIGIVCSGISTAYINNVKILNNAITIASSGTNTYGLVFNYSGNGSSYIDTISGNTIIGGGYGIKASYLKYAKVYNNYLVNNTNGISLTSSQDNLFAYNNFRNAQTNFIGTTSDVPTNTTLSNNIFVTTGTSSYYNLSVTAGNFASCDYNCYYGPNGAGVANHSGKFYATLSSWQGSDHTTGTGYGDEHSISADPLYPNPVTNNLDIDLFSPCTQAGSNITGIYTDIYGNSRRSPRTIGAMEPVLKVYLVTSLLDSVPGGMDSLEVEITGADIDTTILVKEDIELIPSVAGEGNTRLYINFLVDTAVFETTEYIVSLDPQGKIDSVLSVISGNELLLDSSNFLVYSDRVLVLKDPSMGNIFPNPVEIYATLANGIVLSPNQDGLFDTLRVYCTDYDTYTVKIFDLNNIEIDSFEINPSNPDAYWDGKNTSNEYVNPGSYYFSIYINAVEYKYPFVVEY